MSQLIVALLFNLVAFLVGFYLGRDGSIKLAEKIENMKSVLPKRYGKVVIDIDEVEVEKREKKEEKEIIDVKDAIKEYAQNN